MAAQILDGNQVAGKIKYELASTIKDWQESGYKRPTLAVVLVGDDPASSIYVKGKERDCQEVGVESKSYRLPKTIEQEAIEDLLDELNVDPSIDGILVQSPIPDHLDENKLIDKISVDKDVDGFHPYNIGRLTVRRPHFRSCTPKGIMQLLDHIDFDYKKSKAVIIGASNHVGRPMGLELLLAGTTVTTTHKFTQSISETTREADLLVSAVGKAGLVSGTWIKPGAVVIDVGITRGEGNKLYGDVHFESASRMASWITPVPGGVGPMTRVALLQNTMESVSKKFGIDWTSDKNYQIEPVPT